MLPLGTLGSRQTRFTRDEQLTMMSLWAIARSPLMHGGDMTKTDAFTLSLLTNDEVIAVNQRSTNNRPLFNRDELIACAADVPGSPDRYLALFNARDQIRVTQPHARYRSAPVSHDPSTAATIDVDITGAKTLVLFVDPTDDGVTGDSALWVEPTLVFKDGRRQPLSELKWTQADAQWDSASIRRSTERRPQTFRGQRIEAAISTLAASRIEYALPPDVVRFTATGAIDERVKAPAEGGNRPLRRGDRTAGERCHGECSHPRHAATFGDPAVNPSAVLTRNPSASGVMAEGRETAHAPSELVPGTS